MTRLPVKIYSLSPLLLWFLKDSRTWEAPVGVSSSIIGVAGFAFPPLTRHRKSLAALVVLIKLLIILALMVAPPRRIPTRKTSKRSPNVKTVRDLPLVGVEPNQSLICFRRAAEAEINRAMNLFQGIT